MISLKSFWNLLKRRDLVFGKMTAKINILKLSEVKNEDRLDSEYFQKSILKLVSKIEKLDNKKLVDLCSIKSGRTPSYFDNGKIKVVRSGDLNKDLFIDQEKLLKTNEDRLLFIENKDILISSIGRGSIGKINIYDSKEKLATVSEVNILRGSKINPYYLLMFLRTFFGQEQINREITGATGQQHLLKSNVKKILIPILSESFQERIQEVVLQAKSEYEKSKELYQEAENFLLKEIGLKNYNPKHQLSFISKYSNLLNVERIDADYFQPKYDKIIEKVKENSTLEELGNLVSIKKGIEVGSEEYQDEGIPFIRVSNISKLEINPDNQRYITKELYNKLKEHYSPKKEEILLTKDASIGVAFLLKENKNMIISSGVLRLKAKEEINKNYLTLILNSIFVKSQIERDGGGSIILHWKPSKVRETFIPIIPRDKQQKISDLVKESLRLRNNSKFLLEKAKKDVENLMEN